MLTAVDPNKNGRNVDMYHEFRRTEESFPYLKNVSTLDFAYLYLQLTPYYVVRDDFPAVTIYITFVQVMTTFCLGTNLQRNTPLKLENKGRILLSNVRTSIGVYTMCQSPQDHNIYLPNPSCPYHKLKSAVQLYLVSSESKLWCSCICRANSP